MSNYLAWAVIPLVLMIVAAPIFYVLPTSRDKYLTALRLKAKNSGCLVKMASLDKLDVNESELVRSSGRVVQPKYQLMSYTRLIQSKVDLHHSFLFRQFLIALLSRYLGCQKIGDFLGKQRRLMELLNPIIGSLFWINMRTS